MKILTVPMLVRVATIIPLIVVLEYVVKAGFINRHFFASPTEILAVIPHTVTELYPQHLMRTMTEYLAAYTIALAVGLAIGIAMGSKRSVYDVLDPFVGFGMNAPKSVLIPLFILAFGIGLNSIAFFAASIAVFPIIVNTAAGMHQAKPEYLTVARSMGHSKFQVYRKVVLPSALPTFLTGFFLGSNLSMIGVIIMELVMGRQGIGPLMSELTYSFQTPELYAVTLMTILLTTAINGSIWLLSRRLSMWRIS